MAHHILKNEIDLNLPELLTKQKHGIITTLISSFIGLSYEGISSFLHNRGPKALHKAVRGMDSKTTIHCIELMLLEDSMVMYQIYNVETLEHLTNTVHDFHNSTSFNKKLFDDSKAQQDYNPYTQMHKAHNIIPLIHCYI